MSRFRILSGSERRLDEQIFILAVPADKPAVIENDTLIYDNSQGHILLCYLLDVSVHLMLFAQDDEALFVVCFRKVRCFRAFTLLIFFQFIPIDKRKVKLTFAVPSSTLKDKTRAHDQKVPCPYFSPRIHAMAALRGRRPVW